MDPRRSHQLPDPKAKKRAAGAEQPTAAAEPDAAAAPLPGLPAGTAPAAPPLATRGRRK